MDVEQKYEITLSLGNVVLQKNGGNKMVGNNKRKTVRFSQK